MKNYKPKIVIISAYHSLWFSMSVDRIVTTDRNTHHLNYVSIKGKKKSIHNKPVNKYSLQRNKHNSQNRHK